MATKTTGGGGYVKPSNIIGAVLLTGAADTLIGEYVETLVSERLSDEERLMNLAVYDGRGLSGSVVGQAVGTYPFLGDKRVVVVRGVMDMAEEEQGIIASLVEAGIPEYSTLVLVSETVDKRRRIYTALLRHGTIVDFAVPVGNDLRAWLRERLREEGVILARDAGEFLLERDGHDLRVLLNDIRKIGIMWHGENRMLSLDDIRELVGGIPEQDVFKMLEMVSAGDKEGALAALRRCFGTGQEPWAIIPLLIRQFRTILYCKCLSGKGMSTDEMAVIAKVHPYSAKLCQGHARRFSGERLMEALCKLSSLDLAVKSSRMEPKEAIELFVAEMTA